MQWAIEKIEDHGKAENQQISKLEPLEQEGPKFFAGLNFSNTSFRRLYNLFRRKENLEKLFLRRSASGNSQDIGKAMTTIGYHSFKPMRKPLKTLGTALNCIGKGPKSNGKQLNSIKIHKKTIERHGTPSKSIGSH